MMNMHRVHVHAPVTEFIFGFGSGPGGSRAVGLFMHIKRVSNLLMDIGISLF